MSRIGGHARWVPGALVALGSAALALVAPSSWWGVTFVAGVLAAMLALRPVVRAAYRPRWTRSVVVVTSGAALAGATYAFAVEPWGPRPAIAWPLGLILLVLAFVPLADLIPAAPHGKWLDLMVRHDPALLSPEERYRRQ